MFEVSYYFIKQRGALKGLELHGSYKLPERNSAFRDAKRVAKRQDMTRISVVDLDTGKVEIYWNRRQGWVK